MRCTSRGMEPSDQLRLALELPRRMQAHTLESHGEQWCKTWGLFLRKFDVIIPQLCEKLHQLGVDLLRVSPQHAVGAALEFHEGDILDHLRLSS